jgi:hypothetical protein
MTNSYHVGDRIVAAHLIAVPACRTEVAPGAAGQVVDVDPETGDLTIRLEQFNPRLNCWRNLFFVPASRYGDIKLAPGLPGRRPHRHPKMPADVFPMSRWPWRGSGAKQNECGAGD